LRACQLHGRAAGVNRPPTARKRSAAREEQWALDLARRLLASDTSPSNQMVRAEFYKFRGVVAAGRGRQAALYHEALRFNPANANVRELLAGLGEG
jgi:hypothetical protein